MVNKSRSGVNGDESEICQRPTETDRRTFLSQFGGTAGLTTLIGTAGCTSLLGGDPVTIGYEPSFRTLQAPVMVQKGYLDGLDASVEVKNYQEADGNLREGHSNGTVEVGFEDVASVLVRHVNGDGGGTVLAANNQNDCSFLAGDSFADAWANHGSEAFTRFHEQNGEPFALAASEVDRAFLWLNAIEVPREQVQASQEQNKQAIRNKFQDGIIAGVFQPEPMLTELSRMEVRLEDVAWSGNAVSNLPGGVMVVRDEFRTERPEVVNAILKKHVKATEALNQRTSETASIVSNVLGDGLSTSLAKMILEKKTADFLTDPRPITDEVEALARTTAERFSAAEPVPADEIIDPSPYVAVA